MAEPEYSIRAAARVLTINRKTLHRWCADGRVRSRRTVSGRVYIPLSELRRLQSLERRLEPENSSTPAEVLDDVRSSLKALFKSR